MANLRDSYVFQDFTVWVGDNGKIGQSPGFQPPEINIQTEEFRGGGMDGTVEIPMGIEKIEFDFDLHTWDADVWQRLGYGPGSIDVPITFRGYLLSGNSEAGMLIYTRSLLKAVKPGKVSPGQKAEMTVTCVANRYVQVINGKTVVDIDVFRKRTLIGGQDRTANARTILSIP